MQQRQKIQSLADCICAFVEAFDKLMCVQNLDAALAEKLRETLFCTYATVNAAPMSAYEAGIWHDPGAGYMAKREKLEECLRSREFQVKRLFSKGILPGVTYILGAYLVRDVPREVYLACIGLLMTAGRLETEIG